jgi:hypothetical protein
MDQNRTSSSFSANEKTDLFYGYLCPLVGITGVFLNLAIFLVFSNSVFKETLYKYLKLQSLFIMLDLLITSFRPVYYWKENALSRTYVAQLYEKFLITYLASVLEMSAFVSLVLALLHYYLLIKSNSKLRQLCCVKIHYKYVIECVVLISVILFLFQLFEYKIECESRLDDDLLLKNDNNQTNSKYTCAIKYDSFHYSRLKAFLEIFAFCVRDGLNLFLLISLNILIFLEVRNGIRNKKQLLGYLTATNKFLNFMNQTKYKLTLMVILNSFNTILGRLPIMIFFIIRNVEETESVLQFRKIAVLFVYLSYDFNFFFYYKTNKKFTKIFNDFCVKVVHLCCCCNKSNR